MSSMELIKKLRETTGSGMLDCKKALAENNDDLDDAIKWLREKGILKAQKKQDRETNEGVISFYNHETSLNSFSLCKIKCETDFVAKNEDFINFCKELSEINFVNKGDLNKLNETKMANGVLVKDNLVSLIAKIGEKITIRRADFFDDSKGINFSYVHSAIEKGIGKIISVVKLEGITKGKNDEIGTKVAMHVAASNPLAIDKGDIDKSIVDKELEIIKDEIKNSGKPTEMVEKISKGKISKFLNDNSLLNQIWIMDPKKKVSDILKENSTDKQLKILDFVRYKVGEGI